MGHPGWLVDTPAVTGWSAAPPPSAHDATTPSLTYPATTGDGYCRCHDSAATHGGVACAWRGLRHDFKVSLLSVESPIEIRLWDKHYKNGVLTARHAHSRAPDDLYKNGIQRDQFMPCIDLIKSSFTVHCLDSDIGQSAFSRLV